MLLSLEDLRLGHEAKAKYQNRCENFSAEALYRGVPVGAPGWRMEESDTLWSTRPTGTPRSSRTKRVPGKT